MGPATPDGVTIPASSRVAACLFQHPLGSRSGKRYKIGVKFRSARVSWNSGGRLFWAKIEDKSSDKCPHERCDTSRAERPHYPAALGSSGGSFSDENFRFNRKKNFFPEGFRLSEIGYF